MKWRVKSGFTLVELLIVIAIIAFMSVAAVMVINPVEMIDRGNDARRKKDLQRIRTAFEDYYSDKNCYPSPPLLDNLMNRVRCQSGVFSPWLSTWPCDPITKEPYKISVELSGGLPSSCPRWFKVMTKLANENDKDIPAGWTGLIGHYTFGNGEYGADQINYGVSSSNVNWAERF